MTEILGKPDRKPNWHHTLYYKRNFEQYPHTLEWREHPVMVVPMPYYDHENLHKEVKPAAATASEELSRLAMYHCAGIQLHADSLTHVEAFASVRDELELYHRHNQVSELGREALKFSEQFSRQLEFMSEIPILGTDWTIDWAKVREYYDEVNRIRRLNPRKS